MERGKFDSIQLTKNKSFLFERIELDWIEFEELIQLDVASSHWADAPEAILRLFGLCRRPRLMGSRQGTPTLKLAY